MSEKADIKKDVQLEFTLAETLHLLSQFGVRAVVFDGLWGQVMKDIDTRDLSFDYATKQTSLDTGFYGAYRGIQLLGGQVLENNLAIPGGKATKDSGVEAMGKAMAEDLPPKEWMIEKLQEAKADKVDAYRWRFYASSPQTALMLGSDRDPNDATVDWKVECDRLADEKLAAL